MKENKYLTMTKDELKEELLLLGATEDMVDTALCALDNAYEVGRMDAEGGLHPML